ncbi:MAG: peptide deformylase, partial [Rubrivivax sp.]
GTGRHPRRPDRRQAHPQHPTDPVVVERLARDAIQINDLRAQLSNSGGLVPRHARIRYSGQDVRGRPIEREAVGFHAVVVQHECDHLIGRLYPTRMTDLTRLGFTEVLFPELAGADDDD